MTDVTTDFTLLSFYLLQSLEVIMIIGRYILKVIKVFSSCTIFQI
jgi:hypothetical protein